jgi:hypothetical protein
MSYQLNREIFIISTINLAFTAYSYCVNNELSWLTPVHPSLLTSMGLVLLIVGGLERNMLVAYAAAASIIASWLAHLVMWMAFDPAVSTDPYVVGVPLVLHVGNLCTVLSVVLSCRVRSSVTLLEDEADPNL